MRKFLIVLLLSVGFAAAVQAQSASVFPTVAGDTLVMSSSSDTVTKTKQFTAGYSALGFQVNVSKVSGTVIGKAYLYSSLDGSNYVVTDSSAAFTDQATNVAFFTKVTTPYTYYKVQVRPAGAATGTMSAIVKVYYVARKHD